MRRRGLRSLRTWRMRTAAHGDGARNLTVGRILLDVRAALSITRLPLPLARGPAIAYILSLVVSRCRSPSATGCVGSLLRCRAPGGFNQPLHAGGGLRAGMRGRRGSVACCGFSCRAVDAVCRLPVPTLPFLCCGRERPAALLPHPFWRPALPVALHCWRTAPAANMFLRFPRVRCH